MANKFEEMLERLINEDREGAEELFHEIVVEKSRDIYESLLENDLEEETDEEVDEAADEEVDEAADEDDDDEEVDEAADEDDDDDEMDEGFDLDEFEVEADPMDMDMGGDPADDMMGDIEAGDDEDEDGEEEELEDRVVDLEDALDDLKAEFEKMMSDEDGDDEEGDMDIDMDMGDEEGEEEPEEEAFQFEADDEDEDEDEVEEATAPKNDIEQMREYVEKVAGGHGAESKGKAETADNKTSPVASKNDMGGTASNLVAGGEADTKGTAGGLANPSEKEENAGNVNVPGGKASKSMKAMPKGHGAEKKGAGETGGVNSKSTIGS